MRKILLVTSDENYKDLMRLSLEEKFGCEVVCASSDKEVAYLKEKFNESPLKIEVTDTSFIIEEKIYSKNEFHQMCECISLRLRS
jgi:hypothetical protein